MMANAQKTPMGSHAARVPRRNASDAMAASASGTQSNQATQMPLIPTSVAVVFVVRPVDVALSP